MGEGGRGEGIQKTPLCARWVIDFSTFALSAKADDEDEAQEDLMLVHRRLWYFLFYCSQCGVISFFSGMNTSSGGRFFPEYATVLFESAETA